MRCARDQFLRFSLLYVDKVRAWIGLRCAASGDGVTREWGLRSILRTDADGDMSGQSAGTHDAVIR